MTDISFLIGSGFSIKAGHPSTGFLNQRLGSLKENEIFIHTDMTAHFWERNGDKPSPRLQIQEELFIEKFINFYCNSVIDGGDFDYERFFDYYHSQYRNNTYIESLSNFLEEFRNEYSYKKDNRNMLGHFNTFFNQLLKWLLYIKEYDEHTLAAYNRFKELVYHLSSQNTLHFHTLNHDLLLENLGLYNGRIADGFDDLGSPYYGNLNDNYNIRLRRFTNKYDSSFRLYKLHGSIDMYNYHDKVNKQTDVIKTVNGIDLTNIFKEIGSGETLEYQHDFFDLIPKVLSGTTEKILTYDNFYFKDVINHLYANLNSSQKLFIIGYGFGDTKINEILKNEFIDKGNRVVIISPSTPTNQFYHDIISLENVKHKHFKIEDMDLDDVYNTMFND